ELPGGVDGAGAGDAGDGLPLRHAGRRSGQDHRLAAPYLERREGDDLRRQRHGAVQDRWLSPERAASADRWIAAVRAPAPRPGPTSTFTARTGGRAMPVANIRGVNLSYEVLGKSGPWVALAPGGRRGMDSVYSLGQRVADAGYRVLLHD